MSKAQRKIDERQKKQIEQQRKQRRTRILIWSTVVAVILIIVAAVLLKPEPKGLTFEYDKIPTLGQANAPVKLVEFGDFKCTTCKYFSETIEPQLKKDFIDTGKVSLSFMNYTIIAPDSVTAALAGQAVYHQNKDAFWPFYEAVYRNQGDEKVTWATSDFFVKIAQDEKLQIDYDKLKKDIDNKTYQSEVDAQNKQARSNNFNGTPTLVLNGKKLSDDQALKYDNLKKEIEAALQNSAKD